RRSSRSRRSVGRDATLAHENARRCRPGSVVEAETRALTASELLPAFRAGRRLRELDRLEAEDALERVTHYPAAQLSALLLEVRGESLQARLDVLAGMVTGGDRLLHHRASEVRER